MNVTEQLEHMRRHGSSVSLDWGEDNGCWECRWITGGDRYTGVSTDLATAVEQANRKAVDATATRAVDAMRAAQDAATVRAPTVTDEAQALGQRLGTRLHADGTLDDGMRPRRPPPNI